VPAVVVRSARIDDNEEYSNSGSSAFASAFTFFGGWMLKIINSMLVVDL
jgi:hypothetical protein